MFLILVLILTLRGQWAHAAALDFDWSMPDRYGVDRDRDGLVDDPRTADEISPSSWTVVFEITHSLTDLSLVEVSVDGTWVGNVDNPAMQTRFILEFRAEGDYQVRMVARRRSGQWQSEIVTHQVRVQDWLIVGLGDSVGSEEGNPDIPLTADLVQGFDQLTVRVDNLALSVLEAARAIQAARVDVDAAAARFKPFRTALSDYQTAVENENLACKDAFDLSAACVDVRGTSKNCDGRSSFASNIQL